jgi:RNA polymerase sigma factor (sigma-70 family)
VEVNPKAVSARPGILVKSPARAGTGFEELYAIHSPDALRVAYLLLSDSFQAEDVVQEAAIRVLGRFGDLRKPEAFRAYFLRTVVNLAKNRFRRRALERRRGISVNWTPSVYLPPDRDDDLLHALKKIPPRQRAAVVLRYCEDLSEQQTAEVLQTSTKAVKSLVARGLASLRERNGELDA